MAEEQDESSKTEEPTPKRLRESREKGQIPTSREINSWFMIFALTLLVFGLAGSMMGGLSTLMTQFVERPHDVSLNMANFVEVLKDTAFTILLVLSLPLFLTVIAAFLSSVLQHGFLLAPEMIKPKLDKISPLQGLKRMFSLRSLTEFAKGILKLCIVGGIATAIMLPEMKDIGSFMAMDIDALMHRLQDLALILLAAVLAVMTVLAALDFAYQRFEHMKKLRMTKQELKDEYKQTEGDPIVKNRLRQLRQERARRRMMASVPSSDVVITNPTHYAVALKYDSENMAAPRMVAKGTDLVAKRIRDLANDNDVPIIENPPLARALHAGCEIDQEVPPEHYQAVAEVIGYVYRLKGKRLQQQG